MNDINDDSLFTLKDALDGAIIVVVDDARTYDIANIVNEFSKDRIDEKLTQGREDVIAIIKQLDVIDHCYTLESVNKFHYGALLSVVITLLIKLLN